MKNPVIYLSALVLVLAFCLSSPSCSKENPMEDPQQEEEQEKEKKATYYNPVLRADVPDPTVIRGEDGKFYAIGTGANVFVSPDLMDWKRVGNAFKSMPAWLESSRGTGYVWACDVNRIGDRYVMYYALSEWDELDLNGIGIATADSPQGPYDDRGKLFLSNEIGVRNSIDPCYVEENGNKFLIWGSFHGLYIVELSEDGLSLRKDAKPIKVAGSAFEGVMLYKRDGYYYLFASVGSCCSGLSSTYRTVVARSEELFGPYVDKNGKRMLDNAYETVISGSPDFKGTGHNSELVEDDEGQTWMLYHAYSVAVPERGRQMLLDRIRWDNYGWPYVNEGQPSKGPVLGPVWK